MKEQKKLNIVGKGFKSKKGNFIIKLNGKTYCMFPNKAVQWDMSAPEFILIELLPEQKAE